MGEGTLNNVQRLMLGTANLNQMRNEINEVVSTIGSSLQKAGCVSLYKTYIQNAVVWEIDCRDRDVPIIVCLLPLGPELLLYNGRYNPPGLSFVQRVHATLDFFLTSVITEDLPGIGTLKQVFEAAET